MANGRVGEYEDKLQKTNGTYPPCGGADDGPGLGLAESRAALS